MKMPLKITLFLLILACQSCSKNNSPQIGHSDTLNLSLTYTDTSRTPPSNFELLIQEPGGKILLDSLAPVNIPIVAHLHTSDTLVDVTTIYMGTHDTAYTVTSWLGANPSAWQTFPNIYYFIVAPPVPSYANHSIFVENIPGYVQTGPIDRGYVWYSLADIPANIGIATEFPNGMAISPTFGDAYLYSFIPSLGLYNFKAMTRTTGWDTVDLSHMDTARQLNFPRPTNYQQQKSYCVLDGMLDTSDLTKSLLLYHSAFISTAADLEYPTKYVQKFQLRATFYAADSTQVTFYHYGDTVPASFDFPDHSRYTIISSQSDNFSITFQNLTPTFYSTQWKSSKINLTIYSAPNTGVLHPQSLLASLNSQKLRSLAISLSPVNMQFETTGMTYAQFTGNASGQSAKAQGSVPSEVRLTKNF